MVAATSRVKLSFAYGDSLGSVGGNQAPLIRYRYSSNIVDDVIYGFRHDETVVVSFLQYYVVS
jgi:hypothetical protein